MRRPGGPVDNVNAQNIWKRCSRCKKSIDLGAKYYVCSVSTCNGLRTGYSFCSVLCFESHLPGARHRDAGAVEKIAPMTPAPAEAGAPPNEVRQPARIMVKSPNVSSSAKPALPQEVLIIASRLKEYIQAKADYNTSASAVDVLSNYVRVMCDMAIDNARAEGRKTVLDRDFNGVNIVKKVTNN